MTASSTLQLILEPDDLDAAFAQPNVLLVDVGSPETYVKNHIPNAVFLEYAWIVHAEPPRMGLLPSPRQISNVLGATGITPTTHVIAYDDEGGGRACRLLWTLDVIGHQHYSLLNGGLHAWSNEGHPVTDEIHVPSPTDYPEPTITGDGIADKDYVQQHLHDDTVVILDTRSPQEYQGTRALAQRGGHIPGAVNMDWTEAMDRRHNLRLKPAAQLEPMLSSLGLTHDKEIIAHCQTHHRSAHTYIMLKSLGYDKVRGYPGSWSEWGNATDTPIE